MTFEGIASLLSQGLLVIVYVVGPPLAAAMAVGVIIAILQAATQIQETSLTFVPKMVAIAVTLVFTGKWGMNHMIDFFRRVMEQFQVLGR
jgi:flagellar biosynthesis protein FliQ